MVEVKKKSVRKTSSNCKENKSLSNEKKETVCSNQNLNDFISKYSINKRLRSFHEYILYTDNVFTKNTRQEFLSDIKTEFSVKDDKIQYARCHSVSYSSIVASVLKTFNFINSVKLGKIKDIDYSNAIDIAITYLSGLVLAVQKFPLIISDDYKTLSVNNAYKSIVSSSNVEKAFVEYAISDNLILKIIYEAMLEKDDKYFTSNLTCAGNILIEKLNNTSMNLRVGAQSFNVTVGEDYDIISYKSVDDGIIIDTEMDCCCLSHVKNIMYPIENGIQFFSPHSINFPPVYKNNNDYEVVTSYQNTKEFAKKDQQAKVNIYIYDWYKQNKDKTLI